MDSQKNAQSSLTVGITAGLIKTENLHNLVSNTSHQTQTHTTVKTFWTVKSPTPTFVGREDLLKEVHDKLQARSKHIHYMSRMVALVSKPGMGKAELARAYAFRYQSLYENVAWINASTEKTTRLDFRNLAKGLNIPNSEDDRGEDIAQRVYEHISRHVEKTTFFIFHHANRLETADEVFGIAEYLPMQMTKNLPLILITSWDIEWWKPRCEAEVIEIPNLSQEESFQFLQLEFKQITNKVGDNKELEALLKELAGKLDGHPVNLKKTVTRITPQLGQFDLQDIITVVRNYVEAIGPGKKTVDTDVYTTASSLPSGPCSVQIMEFEQMPGSGGTKTRKANLLKREFRRIIEKFGNKRPVAVLSIVGKANKGKSFFLSYVLRYLKALQDGKTADWMGWNDMEARPLQGFKWANGYEVVTKGIWIWSEPITCKNRKGEEFDVLLMDTQGIFDEDTGKREWNVLATLALFTSSVTILNTSNDIQEDTLELLQNFLSFGLLALDEGPGSQSPFQSLVFLVRDWENEDQFPLGNEGGRKFIQRKLQVKDSHNDIHRRLRSQMEECFENIDCFLLPAPGRAARKASFTGSVVNASSDFKDFAKEIEQCIEQLVDPDRFPFKTLNGNVITASGVFELFETYLNIFNSEQVPSSHELYNATVDVCNDSIIAKCVTAFKETFKSHLYAVPFLNDQAFSLAQRAAEHEAMVLFEDARKMGAGRVIAKARSDLKTQLYSIISELSDLNQIRRANFTEILEAKLGEILNEYDMELEFVANDGILSPDEFKDVQNRAASNARQKFQELKCDSTLEPYGIAILDKHIENAEKWLQFVDVMRERANRWLEMSASNAAREYASAIDSSNFMDLSEMETAESLARSKALTALQGSHLQLSTEVVEKIQQDLTAQLDVIHGKAVQQLKKDIESQRQEVELAIQGAVHLYKTSMKTTISSASKSEMALSKFHFQMDVPLRAEDLTELHRQSESHALCSLAQFFVNNQDRSKNAGKLEKEADSELRRSILVELLNFQRDNALRFDIFSAKVTIHLCEAKQQFATTSAELRGSNLFSADFNNKVLDLKNQVKAVFQQHAETSILEAVTLREHLSSLDLYMETVVPQQFTWKERQAIPTYRTLSLGGAQRCPSFKVLDEHIIVSIYMGSMYESSNIAQQLQIYCRKSFECLTTLPHGDPATWDSNGQQIVLAQRHILFQDPGAKLVVRDIRTGVIQAEYELSKLDQRFKKICWRSIRLYKNELACIASYDENNSRELILLDLNDFKCYWHADFSKGVHVLDMDEDRIFTMTRTMSFLRDFWAIQVWNKTGSVLKEIKSEVSWSTCHTCFGGRSALADQDVMKAKIEVWNASNGEIIKKISSFKNFGFRIHDANTDYVVSTSAPETEIRLWSFHDLLSSSEKVKITPVCITKLSFDTRSYKLQLGSNCLAWLELGFGDTYALQIMEL